MTMCAKLGACAGFSMEILKIYPGSKYLTAAITELILQGAPYSSFTLISWV